FIATDIIGLVTYLLVRRGRLQLGIYSVITLMIAVSAATIIPNGGQFPITAGVTALFIFTVGLLTGSTRGVLIAAVIATMLEILAIANRPNVVEFFPEQLRVAHAAELIFQTLLALALGHFIIRSLATARQEGATQAAQERLKLAELTTRITQRTLLRGRLNEALEDIIDEIRIAYPELYHVQIFLVTEDGLSAQLVASTGEVGRLLLERQHALGVGSLSVIGQVTLEGRPVIARAGARDSVHRRNELLPETQIEAAFPMRVGDLVIGALDLQSKLPLALDEADIRTFQSLADSLALAIDNVRQFERAQERVRENQRLAQQAQQALQELQKFNERLTGRAWAEYLVKRHEDFGIEYNFETQEQNTDTEWTPTLFDAAHQRQIIERTEDGKRIIAVPLSVRGYVIGAMEFELEENQELTPEDYALVREVSERFGLAAENTRLLEESQRIAQREALVNEISARLQTRTDVETTLAEA
ncbi:MAG: GAF domain-containing protein, partial [Chloroflexi bacterium]